jgi:hypothetical protein
MKDDNVLTTPVARQILFVSYRLSQGSPSLQHYLFDYVAVVRPQWHLTDEVRMRVVQQLAPAVSRMVARGLHPDIASNLVLEDLKKEARALAEAFTLPDALERDELLYQLLAGFIRRDHHFFCGDTEHDHHQRSRSQATFDRSSATDPFLSFFCHFVLLKHNKCGCSLFDEMFNVMREALATDKVVAQRLRQQGIAELLPRVIAIHNAHHPDCQVALPEWGLGGGQDCKPRW